jgi:hypothetical protein
VEGVLPPMNKMDYKKDFRNLYLPSAKEFSIVDVPPMNFLMVDGQGNPNNNSAYQEVVEALYTMAYGIKFALKKRGTVEYVVPPLEGLWWADEMDAFTTGEKSRWQWTMMIMQPEPVTAEVVEQLRLEAARKKALPALKQLRFKSYHEGLSAQILYFGDYADEGPAIARMHHFIAEQGYHLAGKHHEIYLGDPRRTAPEKLKTVLRQPISLKV